MNIVAERTITGFAVEKFHEPSGKWRVINGRITVADQLLKTSDCARATERARAEADRQAAGWSSGHPASTYRVRTIYDDGR